MSGLEPGYPLGYLTKTMLSNNFTEKIVLKRKTWNKCIFLFSLLFLPNISEARVWKIKQRGTPGVDCDAVDFTEIYKWESVKPGDEIWVYPGIYDSLEITQKFSGTIWKAKDSENNDIIPKPGIENPVLIDGKGSYHVVTINAPNVIIQGFAVKGGSGDGWSQGTGIWIYNVPGIIVQDCLIYNNKNCGIYISNGVKDTIIRRCTLIGNNIVESGGQGVKNNFYQDNTLYEGYIYIYEWIDYKRNNGSTGKGNRCLTGQIGSNQLNPKYLPKLIIDHFPTYRKLLITINGRAMVIGAKLDSAEISIMDKNGKEIKTASIEKFNESINPNGTGDNELLQTRGSKKPEELKEYTGVGRVSLELPELSEGEYKVIAKLKGTELPEILEGSFKRIKLPWEKTDLGISDKVLPPWTPLELNKEKNSINCWSRKYHFANTGFLRQIETAGQAILTDQ
ncbi:MAG TPA: right-handed parallel beta-helix repeat-containing protein, partial [bacterium]|nr:right-handed parallel beta-helix repeat-containing protein [bacterium]